MELSIERLNRGDALAKVQGLPRATGHPGVTGFEHAGLVRIGPARFRPNAKKPKASILELKTSSSFRLT